MSSRLLSCILCLPFLALVQPVTAGAATLRGRVVDPDGRPTANARVLLTRTVDVVASARTDGDGRFRFSHIAAGTYELLASAEALAADREHLTLADADDREITLTLRLMAFGESVVVTAAPVDVPLSWVPASTTVITDTELHTHQHETVADALRLVPGVTIQRGGGRGALTTIFPRGGESDYTLVLVDGVRANAFGGGFDFAHLSSADIEHVEVVRGPQSALYGADSIGAVVQIVTRHGGPSRAAGSAEYGGFGTTRVTFGAAGSWSAWGWGASVERLATDGFRGVAPLGGERVSNDDYRALNGSFSGSWQQRRSLARFSGRLARSERGFPGAFGSDPGHTFFGVDRVSRGTNDVGLYAGSVAHEWSHWLQQRVEATYGDLTSEFTSPFGLSEAWTRRLTARAQLDATLTAGLGATAGAEILMERGGSTFITNSTFDPIPVRRTIAGYFSELRAAPGERLFVTAGVRAEHIRRKAMAPDAFGLRPALGADGIVSINPKLSASYLLRRTGDAGWTRLRANAGTGIRSPDALEIAFTDNPGLKPERSRSFDAGVQHVFANGAVAVEATTFVNRFDDLIVAVGRSLKDASRYRTDNIANARARGLEVSMSATVAPGLKVTAGYTYLDSAILGVDGGSGRAPAPFAVGDSLLRRPRHHGFADVQAQRDRATAYVSLGARGRALDVDPSRGADPSFGGGLFIAPGYAVVRAGGSVKLHRFVEAFGRIENLFDRKHEEFLGFPALGRSASVGVRLAGSR
ncbi:MAG: TonB-dependent receptor [Acidobacteria bacterium]|nr:TonB-dependent receptor [Acidobacteriota bacterium]